MAWQPNVAWGYGCCSSANFNSHCASMLHRISAGVIAELDGRILQVNHSRPGRYDFWVCPGGGVKGVESLEEAAAREAAEETGLTVGIGPLIYIEELLTPECRYVKFWFSGTGVSGTLDVTHPEGEAEWVKQACWRTRADLGEGDTFPSVLQGRYWEDRSRPDMWPIRLPLRHMTFW